MTREDYEKLNNVSKRTAIRDLNNMIAKGILKTSGTTDDKKMLTQSHKVTECISPLCLGVSV